MRVTERRKFTSRNDKELWDFLISELRAGNQDAVYPKGNNIWTKAQNNGVCTPHTFQSMRDRFRRSLLPRVLEAPVSAADVMFVCQKLGLQDKLLTASQWKKRKLSPSPPPKISETIDIADSQMDVPFSPTKPLIIENGTIDLASSQFDASPVKRARIEENELAPEAIFPEAKEEENQEAQISNHNKLFDASVDNHSLLLGWDDKEEQTPAPAPAGCSSAIEMLDCDDDDDASSPPLLPPRLSPVYESPPQTMDMPNTADFAPVIASTQAKEPTDFEPIAFGIRPPELQAEHNFLESDDMPSTQDFQPPVCSTQAPDLSDSMFEKSIDQSFVSNDVERRMTKAMATLAYDRDMDSLDNVMIGVPRRTARKSVKKKKGSPKKEVLPMSVETTNAEYGFAQEGSGHFEETVGEAVRNGVVTRDEVLVVEKLVGFGDLFWLPRAKRRLSEMVELSKRFNMPLKVALDVLKAQPASKRRIDELAVALEARARRIGGVPFVVPGPMKGAVKDSIVT